MDYFPTLSDMSNQYFKVAVIGSGNGGQTIAGHMAAMGHNVILYNRTIDKLEKIIEKNGIHLTGAINTFGSISRITDNLKEAISGCDIIMIATTADAHGQLASEMLPFLKDEQIIVLNPGRTGGALEMRKIFNEGNLTAKVYLAECQTLIYACRQEEPGFVKVIGMKDRVYYATYPAKDITKVHLSLSKIYKCLLPVDNILITSLENIGAIFHPTNVIFNAAKIERSEDFYFYNDMTPSVCSVLENVDAERLMIGNAYGIKLKPAEEWISYAYEGIPGNDLLSKMKYNPAYYKISAPKSLNSRLLTEDIPTGILPMIELGRVAGLKLPLMNAVYTLSSCLLDIDFRKKGRTLERLGLNNLSVNQIIDLIAK